MIDTPIITLSKAKQTAVIHLTIPRAEIQQMMAPAHQEVMATIAAQGIAPTGPWFSHHFRMDPKTFDFEVGVPVASPITPAGRVEPGHLPARKIVRTVFHGNYDRLGAAWGEFDAWIRAAGHMAGVELWERYVKGPESSADPAAWETELNRPLVA